MYVFGDSLSATSGGGLGYPPPAGTSADNYYQGRFSNGKVWPEYLAQQLGIAFDTNHDYSFFGDTSYDLSNNIVFGNYYPPADIATSLYVLWTGCSDCFLMAVVDGTNSWTEHINEAMTNLAAAVELLYGQGVRTLVLPNSVDISRVPFFTYTAASLGADTNLAAQLAASGHQQVPLYNAALARMAAQEQARHPDLALYAADFYSQFNLILNNPGGYGVTNILVDALEDPGLTDKSFNGPGANYLYWDYLHPTTKVHSAIANSVLAIVVTGGGPRISLFTRRGSANQFSFANLPVGKTGALEVATNLTAATTWRPVVSIVVTQAVQTVSISTNLGRAGYFRLHFP
jgi:phospholipase/lecithinase/hemolysin